MTGDVEQARIREIARRVQALDAGEADTVAWSEAKERIAGRLRERRTAQAAERRSSQVY